MQCIDHTWKDQTCFWLWKVHCRGPRARAARGRKGASRRCFCPSVCISPRLISHGPTCAAEKLYRPIEVTLESSLQQQTQRQVGFGYNYSSNPPSARNSLSPEIHSPRTRDTHSPHWQRLGPAPSTMLTICHHCGDEPLIAASMYCSSDTSVLCVVSVRPDPPPLPLRYRKLVPTRARRQRPRVRPGGLLGLGRGILRSPSRTAHIKRADSLLSPMLMLSVLALAAWPKGNP
ncbi:hypothetical protein BC826DRAFT_52779 [Russula brevipes]|nr:hypothetical protein BC826DRAFT_52779 [Russula brevipes]